MVEFNIEITVVRQCDLLEINRSSVYYKPVEKVDKYANTKECIVEVWNDNPARGARFIRNELKKKDFFVSRKKIGELMKELGIAAIFPKPNLSRAAKQHKKYPYLLRGVEIVRPNQVWSTDITYIKLSKGYVYLVAIIDWYSRKVLSWRLSTTFDNRFCVDALREALNKYGNPEIFNTDQGSHFTANNFIEELTSRNIKVSMDGKGRALDNVYIERLWRTVKYEHVFLWRFDSVLELRDSLKHFFFKYNYQRGHQSLNERTPDEVYCEMNYEKRVA